MRRSPHRDPSRTSTRRSARRSARGLLGGVVGTLALVSLAAGCTTGGSGGIDASGASDSGTTTSSSSDAGTSSSGTSTPAASADASTTDSARPSAPDNPSASPSPDASSPAAPATPAPAGSALSQAQPPERWAGTVLGDPGATDAHDDDFWQVAGMFHDDNGMVMGRDPITASQIENSDLAGGQTDSLGNEYSLAGCEGSTKISTKNAVTCTMTSPTAPRLYVYIRATFTAYGHPGLIYHFTKDEASAVFKLPGGDLAVGSSMGTSTSLDAVTPEEAAGLVSQAVLTQHDHEWDGSPDPVTTCEVRDGGKHLMCSVTGSPAGGAGDGTWYGTYKPNDDDRVQYLFTRLPAEG